MPNESQIEAFDKPEPPGFSLYPPHLNTAGHFIHPCGICGKPAFLGHDVCLRRGNLGWWRCFEHQEVY